MAFYTIVCLFVGICQKGRQQKPTKMQTTKTDKKADKYRQKFCRYLFAFLSVFVCLFVGN
jgi:hypothetical protein